MFYIPIRFKFSKHVRQIPELASLNPSGKFRFMFITEEATEEQKASLIIRLKAQGRQTMNLEEMPGSELLLLKRGNELLGFCGYNSRSREYPEVFSQTIEPQYRGTHLGSFLVYEIVRKFQRQGLSHAYFRMTKEEAKESTLLNHRMSYRFCEVVPAANLPAEWVNMCRKCALYGHSCPQQVFVRINVNVFLEVIRERFNPNEVLGEINFRVGNTPVTIRSSV